MAESPDNPSNASPTSAGWPTSPPGARSAASLRGRLFLTWMIGLAGLYLLLVVALLVSGLGFVQWPQFWQALHSPDILYALKLSVWSSLATMVLSLLVAVPAGYLLARYRFPGKLILDTLLDIPIVLPPLVVGVLLLILFSTGPGRWFNRNVIELVFTPQGVVLAQFVVACAFGIRLVKATFEQIDPRLAAVARTLGATQAQAFFHVTLPMARSGVLAAAVVTWARAIGEFGPILIFCGASPQRTEVLPTSIYLENQVGNMQAAMAVSLLMVLLAMATLLVFKLLGGRVKL